MVFKLFLNNIKYLIPRKYYHSNPFIYLKKNTRQFYQKKTSRISLKTNLNLTKNSKNNTISPFFSTINSIVKLK
ncbi:hypothetical protein TPENAI_60851 [Tenacibaculum litopenaei]